MNQVHSIPKILQRSLQIMVKDHAFRRVVINSGWLVSSNTIAAGVTLLQGIILTRALGVSQYGILVLITTYVMFVNQIIDSRVWEAVIKFVPHYSERGETDKATAVLKLFYLIDAFGSVITLVFVTLTANLAADTFVKDSTAAHLIRLYSLFVVIDFSTETSSALLRLRNRFKWLSYHSVGTAIMKTGGAFIVWMVGANLAAMLTALLITSALSVVAMQLMAYFAAREMGLTRWRSVPLTVLRGELRSIFSFILYSNLTGTSRLITSRIDILVLGWFSTPVQAGLYELAKRLTHQALSLLTPVYTAVYPEISRLIAQREYQKVHSLQRKLTRSILVVIFPICASFTIACIWVIPTIFGQEFVPSVPLAQIMVWTLLWTPLIWFPGFLLALGKSRTQAALTWADAMIYLVLLLIMVPAAGGLGAAVATLLRFTIWIILASRILIHINRVGWYRTVPAT